MNEGEHKKLDDVISFVQAERRVCPEPVCWDKLWRMLPGRTRAGKDRNPQEHPPVAWRNTSNENKREVLVIQLKYAAKHGVLEKVKEYLKSLNKDQWTYEGVID